MQSLAFLLIILEIGNFYCTLETNYSINQTVTTNISSSQNTIFHSNDQTEAFPGVESEKVLNAID